MVALARQCYEHVWVLAADAESNGFWDRHYALVKATVCRTAILHMHLNAKAVAEDSVAFALYVNLCAVDIFLHEAAIDEVEKQELPKLVAAESSKRSTAAAFKIASAVRMNWPVQRGEERPFLFASVSKKLLFFFFFFADMLSFPPLAQYRHYTGDLHWLAFGNGNQCPQSKSARLGRGYRQRRC